MSEIDTLLIIGVSTSSIRQLLEEDTKQHKSLRRRYDKLETTASLVRLMGASLLENIYRSRRGEIHCDARYVDFNAIGKQAFIGNVSGPVNVLVPHLQDGAIRWAIADHVPVSDSPKRVYDFLKSLLEIWKPRTIGISSSFIIERNELEWLVEVLVEVGYKGPIILGGSRARLFFPRETIVASAFLGIDVVCYGDGELVYPQVVRSLLEHQSLGLIPNIVFWSDGSYQLSSASPYFANLDQLPLPTPDSLAAPSQIVHLESSRGCPYRCGFCSYPQLSGKIRFKSAERLYKEFVSISESSAEGILCLDSNFTTPASRLEKFCSMLVKTGFPLPWYCYARADDLSANMVSLMADAGCRAVYMGIETINDETLKVIGKTVTIRQVENAIRNLRDNGLLVYASFIVGLPGDPANAYLDMLRFIKEERIDVVTCNPMRVEPGTPFYLDPSHYGLVLSEVPGHMNPHWSHSDMDIGMAIQATVEFYERLLLDEIAATHDHVGMFGLLPIPEGMTVGDVRSLLESGVQLQQILLSKGYRGLTSSSLGIGKRIFMNSPTIRRHYLINKEPNYSNMDPGLALKMNLPIGKSATIAI